MNTSTPRPLGPARIVAVALVAVAAFGLAYLRLASGSEKPRVPSGAHAGQVTLHRCTYGTERGAYAADCGTLVVREDRRAAHTRLIALPVVRIHALAAHPAEPLFRLQGGPGTTNMKFAAASRFAGSRDVVLVGYRGVDGSVRLDCPEVASAMKHARDLVSGTYYRAAARAYGSCATRLRADGVDLAGYSLPERVDDLEAARRAFGYRRVDLLGESAGTRTAMIYAWRYPKSVARSVMLGVNPPGHFLWYAKTTDEQVRKYAALCARDASCSGRTRDLAGAIRTQIPERWWFLPIKRGNAHVAGFFGLFHATDVAAPISSPMTIRAAISAADGDPSGLWFQSVLAQLAFPDGQVWGDVASVSRADARTASRYFSSGGRHVPATDFLWAGGRLRTAWPSGPDDNAYSRVRTSLVPTLLVGGAVDVATPPQTATRELLPYLPNGRQVVLPNLGHTDDIWSYEPAASAHLINRYLADGTVDTSRYTFEHVDFTPGVTQTALAKYTLGTFAGFAALAALALLWLPLRIRRRGQLGRVASATVRSLYVLVLGLGGWFAAVLVLLAKFQTVPLDSEVVAGISIGAPVGLGVYWAWVHRDWSRTTRWTGLAASVAAATVGAWLGGNAITGLLAVLTAVVGAAVGANAVLLALDISRDHPARAPSRAPRGHEGGTTMERTTHGNLAARMGRWSASHWKTATFGWLAFVVVAFGMSSLVGIKSPDPNATGPGQSGRMDKILNEGFKQPAGESVLIQSRSLRTTDPAFAAAIGDVIARVSALPAVQHVHRGEIAKDGHAALVDFEIRGDKTKAIDKVKPIVARVAEVQKAHPQLFIGEFGQASAVDGTSTAFSNDLAKAGTLSLPVTMAILLVAFGALVAAGIPLLLGLTAVFATFGVLALPSHLIPIAQEAPALVLLVGLAVAVDYAMFYLKRERQERAAGRSEHAALEAAAATSGHSVLISGLTVMVSMSGMFLIGDATFASFGLATMVVVAIAVLGSLTVLPALLSRLGDKVDRLRVPFVGRQRSADGESRFWGAIVERVLRRPVIAAVVAGGALLALAAPALQLHLGYNGPDTLPKSLPVVQTYDRMQQAFPGNAIPATVVVKAPDVNAPPVRTAIGQLERRAHASGRVHGPITVDVNTDATVANITVPIDGTGADAVSNAAVATLRSDIVPRTVGALPNTEAGVTGWTAEWKDAVDLTKSKLPIVVGFVLVLAFGLMLFAFRSLVIAITAILLNLLSVAAAYGVLVLVFQHGVGKGLLGFTSTAGISAIIPLLLFVILFGLSMDYHVFMLSRIRESRDGGASTEESIAHGIKSTAGVVTSAAVVMVSVFAVFGTLSMLFFKQFGVGLATAVLLDATIVRGVLLPATMKLLGERNWYLPAWLRWVERGHGEPVADGTPSPAAV